MMEQAAPSRSSTASLTVAVATLDRPDDLAGCLEAILCGELLPAELMVVDQSPYQSARLVVDRFQDQPIPVIYLHQTRRGLSASRNAAIQQSRFPFIAFTDDDCVPGPAWVKTISEAFARPPFPDAVSGGVLPLGPEIAGTHSVSPRENTRAADYTGKTIPWRVGTGGNFAAARDWLDKAGWFDERLGAGSAGRAAEDADMIYRLLRGGARIRYAPDAVIFHKRQSLEKRLKSRWNYGFGIGDFCALWLRRLDFYPLRALGSWLFNLSRELAGSLVARNGLEARQRVLALRGTLAGFFHGLFLERGPR